jgi:ABC-type amino acid transport substrate-binding protein
MIGRLLRASLTVLWLSAPLGGIVPAAAWEPYNPFTFVDSEGILTRADIELLKVVAEESVCALSFCGMPWNRILFDQALRRMKAGGRMDAIFQKFWINSSR